MGQAFWRHNIPGQPQPLKAKDQPPSQINLPLVQPQSRRARIGVMIVIPSVEILDRWYPRRNGHHLINAVGELNPAILDMHAGTSLPDIAAIDIGNAQHGAGPAVIS